MNQWAARVLATIAYGVTFYLAGVIVLSANRVGEGWQTDFVTWELSRWVGFIIALPAVLLIAFALFASLDVYGRPFVAVQLACLLLSGWITFLAVVGVLLSLDPNIPAGGTGRYWTPYGAGFWMRYTVAAPAFLYLSHALIARRRRDRTDRTRARSWVIHWFWGALPTFLFAGFAVYLRWIDPR